MTDTASLVSRLRHVGYLNSDNGDYGLRNPDGPEAADTIEAQAAEIARVREALKGLFEAEKHHDPDDWTGEAAMIRAAKILREPPFDCQHLNVSSRRQLEP